MRKPEVFPGWGTLFKDGYVDDSTVALLISLSLFCCPSKRPHIFNRNNRCGRRKLVLEDDDSGGSGTEGAGDPRDKSTGDATESKGNDSNSFLEGTCAPSPPCLDWDAVQHKLPWGVILLMGSGFALADACKASTLSVSVANELSSLSELPPIAVVVCVCCLVTVLTNITSNTATITILAPILVELSDIICVNPLYLLYAATLNASYAFMLPVATPPNALVFASGRLKVIDMVISGFGLQIMGILLALFITTTYGSAYLKLDVYPEWAVRPESNQSALCLLTVGPPTGATP